jgi:3-isopropylmalate/(R)-2-methylmalate dehydratase large subunit
MAMTLSERIIARAAGQGRVEPGQIVTCRVDLAMMHDSSGPRRQAAKLAEIGARVWDPERVVIITDHFVTETDPDSLKIQAVTREWVASNGVRRFHEAEGICHVVLPERGHLRPGMFVVGGDSHSPTGGAFGAFVIGVGATDMAGVLATGEIWVRVPATTRVQLDGALADGVAAKDVILHLCGRIGINGANYQVVEYAGPGVAMLPVDERMVLTNMSAELGAKTGIIAPDQVIAEWLAAAGAGEVDPQAWQGDPEAPVARTLEVDCARLPPQVAAPHSPANARPVSEAVGTVVDQAYIGACTGAKLEDLRMAARVVAGRRAAVTFQVAPASVRIREAAAREGTLGILEAAGARILPSGCGACIGLGPAALGEARTGIASTSRNFQGRMGARSSQTWLASPLTVAASAITGRITDPRELLAEATR